MLGTLGVVDGQDSAVDQLCVRQVELYFSTLSRRVLRHGDFSSRDELIAAIDRFGINHNQAAKPYRWTYDGTPLKAA